MKSLWISLESEAGWLTAKIAYCDHKMAVMMQTGEKLYNKTLFLDFC